jgi:hypothetical protein
MDDFKDNVLTKYINGEIPIRRKIGVWENVDKKSGKIYYKFSIGNIDYKMFKNDFKNKKNQPDYLISQWENIK